MSVRGIRGAVQAAANTREAIHAATMALLKAMARANRVRRADIAAAFFTVTDDLDADFPAHAARRLGWTDVPLLCMREMHVPGSMPRVVRVLLLVNTRKSQAAMGHAYIGAAAVLRPDVRGPRRGNRG
jgi:chorismate mutase